MTQEFEVNEWVYVPDDDVATKNDQYARVQEISQVALDRVEIMLWCPERDYKFMRQLKKGLQKLSEPEQLLCRLKYEVLPALRSEYVDKAESYFTGSYSVTTGTLTGCARELASIIATDEIKLKENYGPKFFELNLEYPKKTSTLVLSQKYVQVGRLDCNRGEFLEALKGLTHSRCSIARVYNYQDEAEVGLSGCREGIYIGLTSELMTWKEADRLYEWLQEQMGEVTEESETESQ